MAPDKASVASRLVIWGDGSHRGTNVLDRPPSDHDHDKVAHAKGFRKLPLSFRKLSPGTMSNDHNRLYGMVSPSDPAMRAAAFTQATHNGRLDGSNQRQRGA
jgi:hypothetical protein